MDLRTTSTMRPNRASTPGEGVPPDGPGALVYAPYPDKHRGLPAVWSAPNVLILTRSDVPRLPGIAAPSDSEETDGENEPPLGKKQGLIGISNKSKLSLASLLSSLEWRHHLASVHCTLTYWKEWPKTREGIDRAKMAIAQQFRRLGLCGVWRLEFQQRGAPHFHILAWLGYRWTTREDELWQSIHEWWSSYSGNTSEYGVDFSIADGRASWYLAMHSAKSEQAPNIAMGRWWGYIDRKELLKAQRVSKTDTLTEPELTWAKRLYRRSTRCRTRHGQGFRWFLPAEAQARMLTWVRGHCQAKMAVLESSTKRAI